MNRFFSVALAAVLSLGFAATVMADDFAPDAVHSAVIFDIQHFSAGYVYGSFIGMSGSISFDTGDLTKTTFDISVDTNTLDTRNERRDADLKGPDFFDVKQFEAMTFKSTAVTKTGDKTMSVTGDLTLRGVTKSITVPMEVTGIGKGMKGETHVGFRADFTINRGDYGMTKDAPPMIGNDVHVIVAIEAAAK